MEDLILAESKLSIKNHEVDIVVSMMSDVRNHIEGWHQQVYTASIWGVGILIGSVGYWTINFNFLLSYKLLFLTAVLILGLFTQAYLWLSIKALNDNGKVLLQCEKALHLHEENFFFNHGNFFGQNYIHERCHSQIKWVPPTDCYIITILHGLVLLCAVSAILFFSSVSNLSVITNI